MKPDARNQRQHESQQALENAKETFRQARIDYEFAIGAASKWLSARQLASITETSKSQISRGTFNVPVRTDLGKYMPE